MIQFFFCLIQIFIITLKVLLSVRITIYNNKRWLWTRLQQKKGELFCLNFIVQPNEVKTSTKTTCGQSKILANHSDTFLMRHQIFMCLWAILFVIHPNTHHVVVREWWTKWGKLIIEHNNNNQNGTSSQKVESKCSFSSMRREVHHFIFDKYFKLKQKKQLLLFVCLSTIRVYVLNGNSVCLCVYFANICFVDLSDWAGGITVYQLARAHHT